MTQLFRTSLALAALVACMPAMADVTFHEFENFRGRSYTTQEATPDFRSSGFNDQASSVTITGERWEVCQDTRFNGPCKVLRPGRYPSLAAMGLDDRISSMRPLTANTRVEEGRYAPVPVAASLTLYQREGFQGRTATVDQSVRNLRRDGLSGRASSVDVMGDRWEVCEGARFSGRCTVLRPGTYDSPAAMGLDEPVTSARIVPAGARIADGRYAPEPQTARDYRRRNNERLYEANVTSARAVVATQTQRCWMEREEVPEERARSSVPGAVIGAVIGGILGHQIGGGTGKDVATVGGAVGGGLLGARVGRTDGQAATTRDVQRCSTADSNAVPEYWDVSYTFRGVEHRMQMATRPGPTVRVNDQGEPRL